MNYNLLEEPWLPLWRAGRQVHVGLVDAVTNPAITRLLGNSPIQEAALLRLLVAIAHRAGGLDAVPGYLEKWRHRFDLLDPCSIPTRRSCKPRG